MADGLPLSALLPNRLDSMAERVKTKLCDDKQVGAMNLAWGYICKEIHGALKSTLDCDLMEILAEGWAGSDVLGEFADPDGRSAGERSVVEIGEHEIKRELHPVIAVTIGACPCVELKFTFAITAKASGVRLSIVDGHIVGGDLGEAWTSAQLSYDGVPLHPVQESAKLKIPGEFQLTSPGVAIRSLATSGQGAASRTI